MKHLYYLLFFLSFNILYAQNLVPNPSFETIDESTLPPWGINFGANGLIESAVPWFSPAEECTSDLNYIINSNVFCSTITRTGDYSVKIAVFSDFNTINNMSPNFDTPREYIEIKLNDNLISGTEYITSIFANLAACSSSHNGLGAYFSADSILYSNVDFLQTPWDQSLCPLVAQVELKDNDLMPTNVWFHFEETFIADGTESYITIGNFIPDELMNFITDSIDCFGCEYGGWWEPDWLVLDDICVFPVGTFQDIANAGSDTLLCVGESIVLGSHDYDNYLYSWADSSGNEWTSGTIEVSPDTTTTYYLSVKDFAFYETFDSITITIDECNENVADIYASQIKVFPNPATTIVEIESGYDINSWNLLDAVGREVASSKNMVSSKNLVLDVSGFDAGLYFLEMEVDGIQVIKQLVIE